MPEQRRDPTRGQCGCAGPEHNLKDIDVDIPLGTLTVVTGVSGSGKSSLVDDTWRRLANGSTAPASAPAHTLDRRPRAHRQGHRHRPEPDRPNAALEPRDLHRRLGRHTRLFASTPEAKLRGYSPGRFSFNVAGGRCEACKGDGQIKIEMHFLPDVYVPCEVCKGARYNRETLQVTYKRQERLRRARHDGRGGAGVLREHPAHRRKLQTLYDVGLGYIQLGQPATTLSGGEAQRVKLASELQRRSTGRTFYILDEPTTGLHFDDVASC